MKILKFEDIIAWRGFDRNTSKEFIRFLYISKSSCSEVKSMMYLARRLEYLNKDSFDKVTGLCDEISKMIRGLIQSIAIRDSQLGTRN